MAAGTWRWYTKARRVPTLIGKDSSGRRLPGGPYTSLQVVAAVLTPVLMWQTRGLWAATLSGLAAVVAIGAVTFAAVKLLGKVDFAARNPLLLAAGYARQVTHPAGGRCANRSLKPQPVQRSTSRTQAARPAPAGAVPAHAAAPAAAMALVPPVSAPGPTPPGRPAAALTSHPPVVVGEVPAATPATLPDRQSGLQAFLATGRKAAA